MFDCVCFVKAGALRVDVFVPVFELTSQKKMAWDKAQQEASDTGLSEEKIQEKKEQRQTLSTETERKKAERETIEKKIQWIRLLKEVKLAKILIKNLN